PGPPRAVPPHQTFLHRVPRIARRIGRGTVVENPPVGRPGPGPAEGLPHAEGVGVVAPRHLVALLGPGAAPDPATAGSRAVGAQLTEAGQLLACLDLQRTAGRIDQVAQRPAAVFPRD